MNINTTRELMSIALQAERETIRQYKDLAGLMHKAGNEPAAGLFERMVAEETEHERLLVEWMQQEGIDSDPAVNPVKWEDPNVDHTYDDEARTPDNSTPYKALAFAVHNEEKAFHFYTQVAAETSNPRVREYAEVLAREELGHASLLRAERRRAYHAEHDDTGAEPELKASMIHSKADLLTTALHFDRLLAATLKKIDTADAQLKSLAEKTDELIRNNEKSLEQTTQMNNTKTSENLRQHLEKVIQYNTAKIEGSIEATEKLQGLYHCCERSFAFYDAVMEHAVDEDVMLGAQALTSTALDRIGILKQVLNTAAN